MPELLLGPLLRYTGSTQATVWVETDAPCEVAVLDARERTFCVEGHHYALVVLSDLDEGSVRPYEVALDGATNIIGTRWDDAATAPSLEASTVEDAKIAALQKTLRLDTANFPDIVGKTEGMALLGDGSLVIINDDDYGIAGGRTQIVVLRGTGIARR